MDIRHIQEKERSIWDALAVRYEEFILNTKGELRDRIEKETILRAVNPQNDNVILDAGCGVGRHSLVLAEKAKEILSMDFSNESLAILENKAKEKGLSNIKTLLCNIVDPIPIDKYAVDKILLSGVLQLIPDANRRLCVLKELFLILRPGGIIVATVYRWGGGIKISKEGFFDNGLYRYAFTKKECIKLFQDAGFSDIRVRGMINIPKLQLIPRALWSIATYSEFMLQQIASPAFVGKYLLISGKKGNV